MKGTFRARNGILVLPLKCFFSRIQCSECILGGLRSRKFSYSKNFRLNILREIFLIRNMNFFRNLVNFKPNFELSKFYPIRIREFNAPESCAMTLSVFLWFQIYPYIVDHRFFCLLTPRHNCDVRKDNDQSNHTIVN